MCLQIIYIFYIYVLTGFGIDKLQGLIYHENQSNQANHPAVNPSGDFPWTAITTQLGESALFLVLSGELLAAI